MCEWLLQVNLYVLYVGAFELWVSLKSVNPQLFNAPAIVYNCIFIVLKCFIPVHISRSVVCRLRALCHLDYKSNLLSAPTESRLHLISWSIAS